MSVRERQKAYGYVTAGRSLLVFREPDFPEAGIQVPGGTVETGESVDDAIVRELAEELGRDDFAVASPVTRLLYTYDDAHGVRHVHDRHFFHVIPQASWPAHWMHADATPDLGGSPVRMSFYWADLDDPQLALFAGLDAGLPALRQMLEANR